MKILKLLIFYRFLHVYQRVYHNYGDIITILYIYIPTYITLHYITLHYTTLHYTTLHYITLHYITLHTYIYIYIIIYSYLFWDILPIQTRTCHLPKLRAQLPASALLDPRPA